MLQIAGPSKLLGTGRTQPLTAEEVENMSSTRMLIQDRPLRLSMNLWVVREQACKVIANYWQVSALTAEAAAPPEAQ
jgi:hypothetical protein